jgi:hypothetical protein
VSLSATEGSTVLWWLFGRSKDFTEESDWTDGAKGCEAAGTYPGGAEG